MFTVTFERRDFGGPVLVAGVGFAVDRLEWRALGGPWSARMTARAAGAAALWQLAQLLRCGVRICDPGGAAWWGYVSAVELRGLGQAVRFSLDDMYNSVGVIYRDYHPDEWAGVRKSTNLVRDVDSVNAYGTKQRMYQLGQASAADAAAYAQTMLAQVKNPLVTQTSSSIGDPVISAVIECRGWWESLDWKFAGDSRGLISYEKGATQYPVGSSDANKTYGSYFDVGAEAYELGEAWFKLRRVLMPGDTIEARLWPDNGAGMPGNTGLRSSQPVTGAELPDALGWVRFAFDPPYLLPANSRLWAGVRRLGAADPNNYYMLGMDQGLGAVESAVMWNGSSWQLIVPDADLPRVLLGVEETTEQLRRLLLSTSAGQFLSGVRLEASSGVKGRMYRDGSERGRGVAELLLKRGTSAGGRLLATVTAERLARIYAQPAASSAAVVVNARGQLAQRDGRALLPSGQPAGQWARLAELGAAGGLFGYPGAFFVEGCVWDSKGLRAVKS